MKKYLLFIVLIIAMSEFVNGQRYVTQDGGLVTKDGTSWATAYDKTQLQTAINEVPGEVWVAAGSYTPPPSTIPGTNMEGQPGSSRDAHFSVPDGVFIYGGFAVTETLLTERNWVTNVTILSGDIGTPGVNTDNCKHVVINNEDNGTLDGFNIQDGYTTVGTGGVGAGIYNFGSSPTLNNLTISGNTSSFGAGIYNYNLSSPILTNCIITNNTGRTGGGMYNVGSSPTLINCKITNNTATINGGGVGNDNSSSPILTNCTISGNTALNGGGVSNDDDPGSSNTTLNNSIVWGNSATELGQQIFVKTGTITMNYSCYASGSNNVWVVSGGTFTATNNNTNSDPQFVNAAGNDYRILGNSPCADTGLDGYNGQTNDIRGADFARKLNKTNGNPGTIDMGAYEFKFGSDPATGTTFTWTGATNSVWSTTTNWSPVGTPTIVDPAIIPDVANDPVISSTAFCKELTIASIALLTVAPSGRLTVNGDLANSGTLTIQSDITNTGSLITATASVSGSATVQRYMTASSWRIVTSPVSGQSITGFLGANANIAANPGNTNMRGMTDYVMATDTWSPFFDQTSISGNIPVGKGYMLRAKSTGAGVVSFTGALNSAVTNVPLGTMGFGWNCVGNPFTSAITKADILNNNSGIFAIGYQAVYVYWGSEYGDGTYYQICNFVDGPSTVQAGQGFFVKAKSATDLIFNNAMKVHDNTAVLKSATVYPEIKLIAGNDNKTSSTRIKFVEGTTKGLDDGYDAGIFKSGNGLNLYTRLIEDNGVDFGLQCLPTNDFSSMIIPVGIDSKVGGQLVFSAESINLSADCKIILEDKVSKIFTDLSNNVYTTTIAANSSIADRFMLHTSYQTTGLDATTFAGKLSAYAVRNTEILVKGEVGKQAVATLYDVQGKVVLVKNLEEGNLNIIRTPNIKSGIYMLSVKDNERVQRFKIPVRE